MIGLRSTYEHGFNFHLLELYEKMFDSISCTLQFVYKT